MASTGAPTIIETGDEAFETVTTAASGRSPGGGLMVTAIFEPVPLGGILSSQRLGTH